MSHAVIIVAEHQRDQVDQYGFLNVPSRFIAFLEQCKNHHVVLYQSARKSGKPNVPVGYFATAVVDGVFLHPMDADLAVLFLRNLQPVNEPKRMISEGFMEENVLRSEDGSFRGCEASKIVREISSEDLLKLTGIDETSVAEGLLPLPVMPRFSAHDRRIRDPKFHDLVYLAYGGQCAISGVSMISLDGVCSLVAAHIYPFAMTAYNAVSAGILLAPSWHSRFDDGLIRINDDYTWTAVVEDTDTMAIKDRRLLLPLYPEDHPNRDLLRQKRDVMFKPVL